MNPREFLKTAESPATSGSIEADFRSAVSRSYYAVFHVLKSTAGTKIGLTGSGDHTRALDHAMREWPRDRYARFKRLQDERVWADYDLARPVTRGRADHFLGQAKRLVAEMDGRE